MAYTPAAAVSEARERGAAMTGGIDFQAPSVPTTDALINYLDTRQHRGNRNLHYKAYLPAIDADTYASWDRILELYPNGDRHTGIMPLPMRVELIRDERHRIKRGLVLFDEAGKAIVHVVNALLGYDGGGPDLTRDILGNFGVNGTMFEEMNEEARRGFRPYLIVLSRENDNHEWGFWRVE